MFDLEKEMAQWLKTFRKYKAYDDATTHEMELHIRDHMDELIASGHSEQEAFEAAIASFGPIPEIAKEELFAQRTYHKSHTAMITNYTKIAFRNFWKHRSYSMLNIAGLTIGLTIVFLISLFVIDELSFDQFHSKKETLYRVVENQYYEGQDVFPVAVTPTAVAPALKNNYPEINNSTRAATDYNNFKLGEKQINEGPGLMVDAAFFDMFSFRIKEGSIDNFEENLNTLILSETLAKKYFQDQSPIGQTIELDDERFEITAIMEDVPDNSHIEFHYITNFENYLAGDTSRANNWGSNWLYSYVELEEGTNLAEFNEKISGEIKANNPNSATDIYLQPLSDIYLGEVDFTVETSRHGEMMYVKIFSLVAVFILLISCINFMNLSTARSSKRAKEIGLRKTVGAARIQLIFQFLGESILLSFISVLLSCLVVLLLIPYFNELSGKNFDLIELLTGSTGILAIAVIFGTALLTGIVAGSYPAIFLSAIEPSQTLKGSTNVVRGGMLRKVLVITQFAVSVTLIVGTAVVYRQFNFIQEIDLGYNRQNIAYTYIPSNQAKVFAEDVRQLAGVESIGLSNRHPAYVLSSSSGFSWDGKNPDDMVLFHYMSIDQHYVPTMQMRIVDGRNFINNDTASVLINQRAAEIMGMDDPVGKTLSGNNDYKIVGLLDNFNFKSIHSSIEPIVIFYSSNLSRAYIKYDPLQEEVLREKIAGIYNEVLPNMEFSLYYLDTDFDELYEAEQRTSTLTSYFASLAIFISCLGLFGLVAYAVEQRKKEISVRKVLGASVPKLFMLLAFDFSKLVLVSLIISLPLGWLVMDQWLDNYAYRINLSLWIFAAAALAALAITFLTVSYQSLKASLSNPVNALRNE